MIMYVINERFFPLPLKLIDFSFFQYQYMKEKLKLFPINYLRNLAAKNTRSEYVIFIEGDYVVPGNFRDTLKKYL